MALSLPTRITPTLLHHFRYTSAALPSRRSPDDGSLVPPKKTTRFTPRLPLRSPIVFGSPETGSTPPPGEPDTLVRTVSTHYSRPNGRWPRTSGHTVLDVATGQGEPALTIAPWWAPKARSSGSTRHRRWWTPLTGRQTVLGVGMRNLTSPPRGPTAAPGRHI